MDDPAVYGRWLTPKPLTCGANELTKRRESLNKNASQRYLEGRHHLTCPFTPADRLAPAPQNHVICRVFGRDPAADDRPLPATPFPCGEPRPTCTPSALQNSPKNFCQQCGFRLSRFPRYLRGWVASRECADWAVCIFREDFWSRGFNYGFASDILGLLYSGPNP